MFDETIAHVAAAFIEVDGVWYAPAAELMELFASYSAVTMGCEIIYLTSCFAFILLIYEPFISLIRWFARKVESLLHK